MPGPGLQAPNVMCCVRVLNLFGIVETSRSSRRRAAAHIGVAGRPRSRQRRHGLAHTVAQRPESNKSKHRPRSSSVDNFETTSRSSRRSPGNGSYSTCNLSLRYC